MLCSYDIEQKHSLKHMIPIKYKLENIFVAGAAFDGLGVASFLREYKKM